MSGLVSQMNLSVELHGVSTVGSIESKIESCRLFLYIRGIIFGSRGGRINLGCDRDIFQNRLCASIVLDYHIAYRADALGIQNYVSRCGIELRYTESSTFDRWTAFEGQM